MFDAQFQDGSRRFFELVNAGTYGLVLSDLVLEELAPSPEHVRDVLRAVLPLSTIVEVTAKAEQLRETYLAHGVLGRRHEIDALHVALATVAECDGVVSWNFRHIVNYRLVPLYNAVNVLGGYNEIGIYTPYNVIGDEDAG